MTPTLRKLLLTTHIVVSVGWLGAVACVLILAIAGLTSEDVPTVHAAYGATTVIWRFVIVPFSLTALLIGTVQAVVTPWGLLRHTWVLTKFILTLGTVLLLLLHTGSLLPAISSLATDMPTGPHPSGGHHGGLPPDVHLVVAAGGTLLVLLATTTLSIYKPGGRTRFSGQG